MQKIDNKRVAKSPKEKQNFATTTTTLGLSFELDVIHIRPSSTLTNPVRPYSECLPAKKMKTEIIISTSSSFKFNHKLTKF